MDRSARLATALQNAARVTVTLHYGALLSRYSLLSDNFRARKSRSSDTAICRYFWQKSD